MQLVSMMLCSLVIPVYRNRETLPRLLREIHALLPLIPGDLEVVLVDDGSPDDSAAVLADMLPVAGFEARLVRLSRNFGAFPAIRAGLGLARGDLVAVMAADLQEPPGLVVEFYQALAGGEVDAVFGTRVGRGDPMSTRLASRLFWGLYRRLVMPEIPSGGVDVFAVTSEFRDRLLSLDEANSSLLAQLFWLGGRRAFVPYVRMAREEGRSAWTLSKKFKYLADSVFSFTDLPVRLLMAAGLAGMALSLMIGGAVLIAWLAGAIDVPGYTLTILAILFFGGLNSLGLGVIGNYAWRAYDNTKRRPLAIVQSVVDYQAPR